MVMELLVVVLGLLHLSSVNSSQKVIFLLHVIAMIGYLVAMLENVVTTLSGKMTIVETLFADLR